MQLRFKACCYVALVLIAGCTPGTETKLDNPSKQGKEIALSPAAIGRLEEADKADGKSDHVIGKCYVCGLGMDGSEKFAVKVGAFTAHLCSQGCKGEFEDSADKIVLETEIPKQVP